MIIKFSLFRLVIIFFLIIFFPLVQNQWLNLYLFDVNNFSYYKLLYFLSGLVCPIFVCLNSLNIFTYYNFSNVNIVNNLIRGKKLFLITLIILFILSTFISNYIFLNLELFYNLFISNDYVYITSKNSRIFVTLIISIFLIIKKTKLVLKKLVLLNFLFTSIFIWYSHTNNIFINDKLFIPNFINFDNFNFSNLFYLIIIETMYYLWSYISYKSNLSDWLVPVPSKLEIKPLLYILIFYISIILYYWLLSQ